MLKNALSLCIAVAMLTACNTLSSLGPNSGTPASAHGTAPAEPEIWLPRIISNNAVFQAERELPIWGRATPGTTITLAFNGHQVDAPVGEDGTFLATLPPSAPNAQGQPLILTTSDGLSKTVTNIIIGQVWLASGQSNMEWSMGQVENGYEDALANDDPNLRIFKVNRRRRALDDGGDISGNWIIARRGRTFGVTAVGFHFGRVLRSELNQPVGVIQVAWGGTRSEAWTPTQTIFSDPNFADEAEALRDLRQNIADIRRQSARQLQSWGASAARQSDDQLNTIAGPPSWPYPGGANAPTVLFTGMIEPLLPIAVKGTIWYQGEANVVRRPHLYEYRLAAMIESWREHIGGDLPFGIVQIAPFRSREDTPLVQDAQLGVANTIANTGLVVITDITDLDDIHPPKKRPVGERLAAWALRDVYGLTDAYYGGPLFTSVTFEDDTARIAYRFADGLTTRDGKPLSDFEVASADGVFVPAKASIDGDTTSVSFPAGEGVCQIRYAYRADADPQLTNTTGLPASPFHHSECDG